MLYGLYIQLLTHCNMKKFIIENHIPYIKGLLEPFAQVEYLPNEAITPEAVADADALIVRTRTRCNSDLLSGSRCSFIASATIGTDHIDLDYCHRQGITVCNAPGCNAPAVAQYVIATIGHLLESKGYAAEVMTLGVVGVGHVGSIVARWAKETGLKVILNDPPRQRDESNFEGVSLDKVASDADIVTFHTPLTRTGADATYHLCDNSFINSLKKCKLLINSARGEITDNKALLSGLESRKIGEVAIDCWENEPRISNELLDKAFVATPHIAGYSIEGKQRATAMVLEAVKRHFGFDMAIPTINAPAKGAADVTIAKVMESYNPLDDTSRLKENPCAFEQLRNNYDLRHEVR